MSKYVLLGLLFGFLYIMSMVAASIEAYNATDLQYPTANIQPTVGGVISTLSAFWSMLTFSIQGVPIFVNLIFIMVSIMVLYMIVDIVKDLIPFT